MRILVVNVNTSQTMTSVIEAGARRYASAGTQIIALQPYFGAEAVDCNFESYLSAVAGGERGPRYDGRHQGGGPRRLGGNGPGGNGPPLVRGAGDGLEAPADRRGDVGHG